MSYTHIAFKKAKQIGGRTVKAGEPVAVVEIGAPTAAQEIKEGRAEPVAAPEKAS